MFRLINAVRHLFHALLNDAQALAHLFHAHHGPVVTIAVNGGGGRRNRTDRSRNKKNDKNLLSIVKNRKN
jgi:hypothetical protein